MSHPRGHQGSTGGRLSLSASLSKHRTREKHKETVPLTSRLLSPQTVTVRDP